MCNPRLCVLICYMYIIVDLIIFVKVFNMLNVCWVICIYYFTVRSRRYPLVSDRR
jgi:UPF0716 family protein affecting phage T7 exclusion